MKQSYPESIARLEVSYYMYTEQEQDEFFQASRWEEYRNKILDSIDKVNSYDQDDERDRPANEKLLR